MKYTKTFLSLLPVLLLLKFAPSLLSQAAKAPSLLSTKDEVRCNYTRRVVCDGEGCVTLPAGPAFLIVPSPDS